MTPLPRTLEQQVQMLVDRAEIENLMSKHVYYHSIIKHLEELDDLWVKKPENADTASFAQNQGYFIGMKSIRYYYGELTTEVLKANLKKLKKTYPKLEEIPENYGAGVIQMHPLTTQIIEVAGDGKTAKGIWLTPGCITDVGLESKPVAQWIWERYGCDFAKEDGVWKIWHLHMYTDFITPVGTSWVETTGEAPTGVGGAQDFEDLSNTIKFPRPDIEETTYEIYNPTRVPQNLPRMPEPYYTFSETFSY